MSRERETIPYEKQLDPSNSRMCGAACLSMVYRSFGKEVSQAEIWPAIAKQNRFGSVASTTHLMAQDALSRGFPAVAIQAQHPLQALRLCHEAKIRAILNHRLDSDSPTGHYSVMVDLDSKSVVLHDPHFGPARRLSHGELIALWQAPFPNSEIVGNVLIAVAAEASLVPACQFCHTVTPPSLECPRCKNPISLRPAAVLGCMNQECIARMWNYVCCPACDFMGDGQAASVSGAGAAAAPSPDAAAEGAVTEPAGLKQMFEALDNFIAHAKRMPGMANNAEFQQQLQILAGSKAAATVALAEAEVHSRVHSGQLASFVQASKEREDALKKRKEELNPPSTPLDGNALGRALLKNLGFTS